MLDFRDDCSHKDDYSRRGICFWMPFLKGVTVSELLVIDDVHFITVWLTRLFNLLWKRNSKSTTRAVTLRTIWTHQRTISCTIFCIAIRKLIPSATKMLIVLVNSLLYLLILHMHDMRHADTEREHADLPSEFRLEGAASSTESSLRLAFSCPPPTHTHTTSTTRKHKNKLSFQPYTHISNNYAVDNFLLTLSEEASQ